MDKQQAPTVAHGNLLNVMGSLDRMGLWERMDARMLSTWNYHNIVNQLNFNIKLKSKKKQDWAYALTWMNLEDIKQSEMLIQRNKWFYL